MGPHRLRSDIELAQRAAGGDREAFGELARRAAPVISDLLRRMGAQAALADDLTQDALIAALKAIATYRGEAPFAGWAMRIAARLYLKRYRRDARTLVLDQPLDAGTPDPGVADGALRLDLDRALARLSPPERLCVSLCHGAGLTHEEIAGALNTPVGTVKSHVARGLKKLRAQLDGGDLERRRS
jgi:RNA polymerase sigma factor (sigma-70 family)